MLGIKHQTVVLFLATSVLSFQEINAFSVPRQSLVRNSLVSRHVNTLSQQDTEISVHQESARLRKAKLLLEQFTDDSSEEQIALSSSGTSDPALVPDNYWSNGLLDGSDVVTRYAFRRGVKVAEPLVKYDPVAAEKLLFRQPAKWLIRNVQIAGPLGWWAAGVITDFIFNKTNNRRQRAVQLQNAISGLGPAIIKVSPFLAIRLFVR